MNRKITALLSFIVSALVFLPPLKSQDVEPYDLTGFYEQLDAYLERFHDPAFNYDPKDLRGHFSYQPGESQDLYGSADMVYLLWSTGELDGRTTEEGRAEWAAVIQSYQDPDTGWFKLGNETLHFKSHATAYATGALAMLDAKPLYPFEWKTRMTSSRRDMEKWLEQIWWWLVWVGSHEGGGVAAALDMTGEASDQWFEDYLDWLDREANPKTGLWQRAFYNRFYKKTTKHDIGGAAHFWWIYQQRGRPIPYPKQVIDTVLAMQLDSGLWDDDRNDGMPYCINLDAINGLNQAYFQLRNQGVEYRGEDIARAIDKFLENAIGKITAPGGLERMYTNSHDLPGTPIAIGEANKFFIETEGAGRTVTPNPWRSVLDVICWL